MYKIIFLSQGFVGTGDPLTSLMGEERKKGRFEGKEGRGKKERKQRG